MHCFFLLFDRYVFFLRVDIVFVHAFHVHNGMSLYPFLYMNCSSDVSLIQFTVNRLIFCQRLQCSEKYHIYSRAYRAPCPRKLTQNIVLINKLLDLFVLIRYSGIV